MNAQAREPRTLSKRCGPPLNGARGTRSSAREVPLAGTTLVLKKHHSEYTWTKSLIIALCAGHPSTISALSIPQVQLCEILL
jgi:hypothetical protein